MKIFIEWFHSQATEPKWAIFIDPKITLTDSSIHLNEEEYEYRSLTRAAIDDKVEEFIEGHIWRWISTLDLKLEERSILIDDLQLKAANFFMKTLAIDFVNYPLGTKSNIPSKLDMIKYSRKLVVHRIKQEKTKEK